MSPVGAAAAQVAAGVATAPRSPRPMSLQASMRSVRWTAAKPPRKTPRATAELDSAPARFGPIQCPASQPHVAETVVSNTGMASRLPTLKVVVRLAPRTKKTASTRALTMYASPAATTPMTGSSGTRISAIAGMPRRAARSGTEADPIAQR